jgi:hypothetical protein
MREGLLWFDKDPNRKIGDKISRAAERYQAKLQHKPTVCYLSIEDFSGEVEEVNGIRLKPAHNIRPHHFLIGVEQ